LTEALRDIQKRGFFPPTVKYNRGSLFLSDKRIIALRWLTDLVCGMSELSDSISKREIGIEVLTSYNGWLERQM
jgi:hypothetical protein